MAQSSVRGDDSPDDFVLEPCPFIGGYWHLSHRSFPRLSSRKAQEFLQVLFGTRSDRQLLEFVSFLVRSVYLFVILAILETGGAFPRTFVRATEYLTAGRD